ncbi:MAG TPA: hypothetical protein VF958_02285 [Thermoanaerobaculia bacterium]
MRKSCLVALAGVLFSSLVFAQAIDIPVSNWTVPPYTASRAGGGLTTMTDFTPPRVFVAVVPCRVVDTRNPNGPYGGPPLPPNFARTFDIDDGPCGIPAGAEAYSLNFGGIAPPADGFLTAWPTGSPQPGVSQLNFLGGEVVANAAIVPAGNNGAIDVLVNVGTHIYIDINGYFSDNLGQTVNPFILNNTSPFPGATIFGNNLSSGYGIRGYSQNAGLNGAGVFGSYGFMSLQENYNPAGIRGQGTSYGTVGISPNEGVTGGLVNFSGFERAFGILGFNAGALASQAYGVYSGGNTGASGTKQFVEPHPTDPTKVIRYISLEGPEAGTYFRGKGKFEGGTARIRVPEDFRMVTDDEGLTVQITPIGGMASVGVMRADLNEIVVQSSRNFEFYYLVNGIRRTQKNLTSPISEGTEFVPRSATSRIPEYLSEGQKQLLIQNGTYRADGTVNMETAHRNGWDRIWAERERPQPAPSPEP